MAQYFFDVSEWATGNGAPDGWEIFPNSAFAILRVADITWDGSTHRVLEISASSTAAERPSIIIPSNISAASINEMVALCVITDNRAGHGTPGHIPTALHLQSEAMQGYSGGNNHKNQRAAIYRIDGFDNYTELAVTGAWSDPHESAFRFWNRAYAGNGNIKCKLWKDDETEPADWLLEVEDGTYSSGKVGISKDGALGVTQIFAIGVGTDGDPAPTSPVFLPIFRKQTNVLLRR